MIDMTTSQIDQLITKCLQANRARLNTIDINHYNKIAHFPFFNRDNLKIQISSNSSKNDKSTNLDKIN